MQEIISLLKNEILKIEKSPFDIRNELIDLIKLDLMGPLNGEMVLSIREKLVLLKNYTMIPSRYTWEKWNTAGF